MLTLDAVLITDLAGLMGIDMFFRLRSQISMQQVKAKPMRAEAVLVERRKED